MFQVDGKFMYNLCDCIKADRKTASWGMTIQAENSDMASTSAKGWAKRSEKTSLVIIGQVKSSRMASLAVTGQARDSRMASIAVTWRAKGSEVASLAMTGQTESSKTTSLADWEFTRDHCGQNRTGWMLKDNFCSRNRTGRELTGWHQHRTEIWVLNGLLSGAGLSTDSRTGMGSGADSLNLNVETPICHWVMGIPSSENFMKHLSF